jgi:hypothetical protein
MLNKLRIIESIKWCTSCNIDILKALISALYEIILLNIIGPNFAANFYHKTSQINIKNLTKTHDKQKYCLHIHDLQIELFFF